MVSAEKTNLETTVMNNLQRAGVKILVYGSKDTYRITI